MCVWRGMDGRVPVCGRVSLDDGPHCPSLGGGHHPGDQSPLQVLLLQLEHLACKGEGTGRASRYGAHF